MEGDSMEGGSRMDGHHGAAETEGHLSSAAAFVEGGIQDACDDACSICLEAFCESDPSTVTTCKHEFHLQCILEWCQRSSQCPMCWQPISMKDPTSQELLEAVEQERSIRANRSRNATIFRHPMLGDFEFQQLPPGADDAEFEERIIQHLAAAAAMGRTHRIARRDGHRGRSGAQGHPQFIFFSTHPNEPSVGSASSAHRAESELVPGTTAASPSVPHGATEEEPVDPGQADDVAVSPSRRLINASRSDHSNSRSYAGQTTPVGQDGAGPSDLQSFSESLKSRLSAVSMRYRDSITKSTRGWKERLFSRNASMADLGSEVRREVSAGIATVSRMIERLDTRDSTGTSATSNTDSIQTHPVTETSNEGPTENHSNILPSDNNIPASCAANSGPH